MPKGEKKEVRKKHAVYFDNPSLTKQSFKEACDINNIVEKGRLGQFVQGNTATPQYGDFSQCVDYQEALNKVMTAQNMFNNLPAKVRARFANNPVEIVKFIQDKKNKDEAVELGLVEPEAPDRPASGPGDEGAPAPPVAE